MIELNIDAMDALDACNLDTIYEFKRSTQNGGFEPLIVRYSLDDHINIDLPDGRYGVAFQSPDLTRGVRDAVLREDAPLWLSRHAAGVFGGHIDPLEFACCVAECLDQCGYWGSFIEDIQPVSIADTKLLMVSIGS